MSGGKSQACDLAVDIPVGTMGIAVNLLEHVRGLLGDLVGQLEHVLDRIVLAFYPPKPYPQSGCHLTLEVKLKQ